MESGQTNDLLLERALYYKLNGRYPLEQLPLTDNQKRAVRRKAKDIVLDDISGKVFILRKRNEVVVKVEVVRSPQERKRTFNEYHQASDHSGWHKTWEQIAEKYYWKDCSGDVKKWVKECAVCQQRRNRIPTSEGPSNLGFPEQDSHGSSSGEYVQGQTQQFTPNETLTGGTSDFDSAGGEATGQQVTLVPADEESEGRIGPEHGTDDGSHYAPNTDEPAPLNISSISSEANFPVAAGLEVMPVPSGSGHNSMLLQMASFPCGTDEHHQQWMTPLAESGTFCIKKEMPNDEYYCGALKHANDLSDAEEESVVHSHPTTSLAMAKIARPMISYGWNRRIIAEYKMPSPNVHTLEDYMHRSYMKEDGGYNCVESIMRVTRTLKHLHSKRLSGHGAFSDPSSIVLCVPGTSGHGSLGTFLIPNLGKLAERKRQEADVPYSHRTFGLGMVDDITSLGGTLRELLPLLQDRRIHVSKRLLGCFESATDHCQKALDIATIAEDLNVETSCLCNLHVKLQQRCEMCTLDIVCYEGENIYEVVSRAWLDGKTVESYGCRLIFNDSNPVTKDSEVIYPVCTVQLVPC